MGAFVDECGAAQSSRELDLILSSNAPSVIFRSLVTESRVGPAAAPAGRITIKQYKQKILWQPSPFPLEPG